MNRKLSTRNAELVLRFNELLGRNKELEQTLAVTSMKSAEELMHTSTDRYQQIEFSVPSEPLRRYMVFPVNKTLQDKVWFNGKFSHKTGEVVDIRIGRRTATDSTDNSRMTP